MRRRVMMLPFAYSADYVPYKRRNPEKALVRGDVPVPVRDLDGAQAPVAFRITRHEAYDGLNPGDRAEWMPDGPEISEYRVLDGSLMVPVLAGRAPVSVEAFERGLALPVDSWRPGWGMRDRVERPTFDSYRYPTMSWYVVTTRFSSDRDVVPMKVPDLAGFLANAAEFEGRPRLRRHDRAEREPVARDAMAAAIAIVDGGVWSSHKVEEPHWAVCAPGRLADSPVRLDLEFKAEPLHYVHRFRLDRFAEAEAFARAVSEREGRRLEVTTDKVEMLDPSALRLDETVEAALQAVYHLEVEGGHDRLLAEAGELVRIGRAMSPSLARRAHEIVSELDAAGAFAGGPETYRRDAMARLGERLSGLPGGAPDAEEDIGLLGALGPA